MALGNAQNDDSMIEFAGLGVAMGNSIPGTLKIADVTTADNNHDGVGKAIENMFLSKDRNKKQEAYFLHLLSFIFVIFYILSDFCYRSSLTIVLVNTD